MLGTVVGPGNTAVNKAAKVLHRDSLLRWKFSSRALGQVE